MSSPRQTALHHLEYNIWANSKLLACLEPLTDEELRRDLKTSFESIWGTLLHLYRADALWYLRLSGQNPSAKLNDFEEPRDFAGLREVWMDADRKLLDWVGTLGDADWQLIAEYRFLNGTPGASPVYESLLHVVNHGTYHRGQVVSLLRQLGKPVVQTDFLLWVREVVMPARNTQSDQARAK